MKPGTFGSSAATTEGVPLPQPHAERRTPTRERVDLPEPELVRRAQLGSSAAFEQLAVARGPALYRYLAVRLRDEGDARDVLQETLVAAWQRLPSLREAERFWPWLCGIAAHKAVDAARRRRPEHIREIAVSPPDDDIVAFRDAVAALPEHFRQVLLLRYLLGLTEAEVADALGMRVGTVKSRTARARKALEALLR
jgi:RNA polymerase sigma-70 factor, ECF subfamily